MTCTATYQSGTFCSFALTPLQTFLLASRYSISRPVETHMAGAAKNLASHVKVSIFILLYCVRSPHGLLLQ